MIKKIIFDIDNTLIDWKDDYDYIVIKKTYENLGIEFDNILINKTILALYDYEKNYSYFNKELFIDNINKYTNLNLTLEFFRFYFNNITNFATPAIISNSIINTLQYLSSKYELVALTNWFTVPQIDRLKKVNIYKYFRNVFGTEDIKIKPAKESFYTAIGNNKPQECLMIGDNLDIDIYGALSVGVKAIYLSNSKIDSKDFICIQKIEELMHIL